MRLLSAAFSALVVVLCFGLASCGSGSAEPDASAKPSASPTPTATPPTKPAGLDESTPEGAAAFVYYWIDVFNYANTSGDLSELKLISGFECGACTTAIDMIAETSEAGGHVSGNEWLARNIQIQPEGDSFFVTAEIVSDAGVLVESSGASPKRIKPHTSTMFMWADNDGSSWSMTDMGSELEE